MILNSWKTKVQSQSGVTIVMALFFLLLASLVSVVVITAAGSASRNLRSDKDQQQAYLSVTSAAEYIASEVNSAGFIISSDEKSFDPAPGTSSQLSPLLSQGVLSGTIREQVFYLKIPNYEDTITPVEVHFSMGNYRVQAKLCLAGAQEDNYYLTLTIPGKKDAKMNSVSWSDGSMSKGW